MFWKAIALLGSGSFFVVGWGVFTDPLCNSVSFRGGGARTVVTTCFRDSSGDFSRATAVTGSFLIGVAILAILFWPLIKVYIVNSKFQQSLKQMAREIENNRDIEVSESNESPQEPTQNDSLISSSLRRISENKLISIILIAVLVFGFYKVAGPKISLLNPITCSGLKRELGKLDVVGRQIWQSYQFEVSNLSRVEMYSDSYYLQVGNAARRALQLNINDGQRYTLMTAKLHCVKDPSNLTTRLQTTSTAISYLNGVGTINGEKFKIENGWNTSYYQVYFGSESLLK